MYVTQKKQKRRGRSESPHSRRQRTSSWSFESDGDDEIRDDDNMPKRERSNTEPRLTSSVEPTATSIEDFRELIGDLRDMLSRLDPSVVDAGSESTQPASASASPFDDQFRERARRRLHAWRQQSAKTKLLPSLEGASADESISKPLHEASGWVYLLWDIENGRSRANECFLLCLCEMWGLAAHLLVTTRERHVHAYCIISPLQWPFPKD